MVNYFYHLKNNKWQKLKLFPTNYYKTAFAEHTCCLSSENLKRVFPV